MMIEIKCLRNDADYEIAPPDMEAYLTAKSRWDSVAKPLGGLGELEEMVQKIAAVQRTADVDLSRRCVVIICADNGVTAEGVTQSDSSVTALCARAMARGTSSINQLAGAYRAEVLVVDAGMAADVEGENLLIRKIARGTASIASGPAMTRAEAQRCLQLGIDLVGGLKQRGVQIAAAGEMGIGNTTTAAAVTSVLLGLPPRQVTGRGAGLDSAGLARKIAVIERAIRINRPSPDDPLDVISKVGGFDIGVMAGMHLGEGTGAVMLLPLLDGALTVYRNAHRFEQIGLERYVKLT